MGEWIADASFIIHGAKVRARDQDEADEVVYEIAESELFDDYVPLDAESTRVSMIGAKRIPGSENSRGVPLMTGDVVVTVYGMVLYADTEAEAEDEVRDAMNDWAPAEFPFDGGRDELVITVSQSDDDDDYDDEDDDSWSLRSRISGKRSAKAGSASKSTGSKRRRVGKAPAKPGASEPRQRDSKGRFVSNSCRSKAKPKTTKSKPKTKGARR